MKSFSVQSTVLLNFMRILGWIIPQRSASNQMTLALLSVDADGLTIFGTNLESNVTLKIPSSELSENNLPAPGWKFAINAMLLKKLVFTAKGMITFSEVDEENVTVTIPSGELTLKVIPSEGLDLFMTPDRPWHHEAKWAKLESASLRRALKAVNPFRAKEIFRAVFKAVQFEFGAGLRVVATDGFHLGFQDLPLLERNENDLKTALMMKNYESLQQFLALDSEVEFTLGSTGGLICRNKHGFMDIKVFSGQLPDYERVISTVNRDLFIISTKDLLMMFKKAAYLLPKAQNASFHLKTGVATITISDDESVLTAQLPIQTTLPKVEFSVRISQFLNILHALQSPEVAIDCVKPTPGNQKLHDVLIFRDEGAVFVISTLRI